MSVISPVSEQNMDVEILHDQHTFQSHSQNMVKGTFPMFSQCLYSYREAEAL